MENRAALLSRSLAALSRHDLSLGEHLVMRSIGYRVNVAPAALVTHVLRGAEGDTRGETALADLEAALASCVRRGLLKVLDAHDFDAAGRRLLGRDTPLADEPGFDDCAPGHVDFTPEGHRVHVEVMRAIGAR